LVKSQESREYATNEPINRPSNKKKQVSGATPMDGETRDDNTPMKEAEGDAEMTLSEVGTKYPDLWDFVEREVIYLLNILEQWKRRGVDNIPTKQLDRIQYMFLIREEVKSRGLNHTHGDIGYLGVKVSEGEPQLSPKKI